MKETIEQIGYTIIQNYGNGYGIIKLNTPYPRIENFPCRHLEGMIYFHKF